MNRDRVTGGAGDTIASLQWLRVKPGVCCLCGQRYVPRHLSEDMAKALLTLRKSGSYAEKWTRIMELIDNR